MNTTAPGGHTCASCIFAAVSRHEPRLECRRNPPEPVGPVYRGTMGAGWPSGLWPLVAPAAWCGEHRPASK